MAIGTLQAIINKVRLLTGTANDFQLTDADIIDQINSFYLFDLPAHFRSLKLKDRYVFNTIRGIDTYAFDSERYTTVQMPCYCMKKEIQLFQDPWNFYGVWFNWQQFQNFATGDGTLGPYSGLLQAVPIVRSTSNNPMVVTQTQPVAPLATGTYPPANPNVAPYGSQQVNPGRVQNILITANISYGSTVNVTDDGAGNLIGDCSAGTINYETGAIAGLVFTQMVPSGEIIQCQYNPATIARPQAILFFQNQFTLRPVPDMGYTVELVAYRQPSQVLLGSQDRTNPTGTGVPEQLEWWECLAVGAAKKIYENRLDSDGVNLMNAMLNERYDVIETRTYAQLGKQRVATIYADQLNSNYGSTGWSFFSGGS